MVGPRPSHTHYMVPFAPLGRCPCSVKLRPCVIPDVTCIILVHTTNTADKITTTPLLRPSPPVPICSTLARRPPAVAVAVCFEKNTALSRGWFMPLTRGSAVCGAKRIAQHASPGLLSSPVRLSAFSQNVIKGNQAKTVTTIWRLVTSPGETAPVLSLHHSPSAMRNRRAKWVAWPVLHQPTNFLLTTRPHLPL